MRRIMIDKTALREVVLYWIRKLPIGRKFKYSEIYDLVEIKFPNECSRRGRTKNEPRYKHDARLAVWDAMHLGLIRHTGIRGQRVRV